MGLNSNISPITVTWVPFSKGVKKGYTRPLSLLSLSDLTLRLPLRTQRGRAESGRTMIIWTEKGTKHWLVSKSWVEIATGIVKTPCVPL